MSERPSQKRYDLTMEGGIERIRENFSANRPSGSELGPMDKLLETINRFLPVLIYGVCAAFLIFMQRYYATAVFALAGGIALTASAKTHVGQDKAWISIGMVQLLVLGGIFILGIDNWMEYSLPYYCAVAAAALGLFVVARAFSKLCQRVTPDNIKLNALKQILSNANTQNTPIYDVLKDIGQNAFPAPKTAPPLTRSVASILLILLMVILTVADPHISGVTGTGYTYQYGLNNTSSTSVYEPWQDGVQLTFYGTDEPADAVIPAEYEGKKVLSIGQGAFANLPVTSVVLPDTVTLISARSFYHCDKLTQVRLPHGLTAINAYAFAECSSLKEIDLPDTLQQLHAYAFAKSGLESIVIPQGVKEVKAGCFQACAALSSVTLPQKLEKISEYVFYNCKALQQIKLPESLRKIGPYAFSCSGLRSITIPGGIGAIKERCFASCSSLESVEIKFGVTRIGSSAFRDCGRLTKASIPASVKVLASSCFRNCSYKLQAYYPIYALVSGRAFKGTR